MEESQNQVYSYPKYTIIRFLERSAVPSYKHVLFHFGIAILLLVVFILLYTCLDIQISISANAFVAITSAMAAASGALLAISLALATFFSRYVTDWRDRLIDALERGQTELESQMAQSARKHPEISRRLSEIYVKFSYYIPGQSIDADDVFKASKVFDDWAKTRAKEAQKANRTFDFGDLSTYESFEKHLFDASLRITKVRGKLVLLSAVERISRSIAVFPPLFLTWAFILLFSLVFAIVGSVHVLDVPFHFPILIMLLYLILIALISLMIGSINLIGRLTRILETGYTIAVDQLAHNLTSVNKITRRSTTIDKSFN
jgi:hypothetical protein